MEDHSANSVVNRNEPIPVISPRSRAESVSSTTSTTNNAQHKHKRSGSTSGRSIQDRLFTKYVNRFYLRFHSVPKLTSQDFSSRCSR